MITVTVKYPEGNTDMYNMHIVPSGRSVKIGDAGIRTWTTYNLIATERPHVNPPSVKTKYVDIPGDQGLLDMTDIFLGYQAYGNRTGSWEFALDPEYAKNPYHWQWVYTHIMNEIHGRAVDVYMPEDNFSWFYRGRVSVNTWKSDKNYSTIVLDYDLGPYKWSNRTSTDTDEWYWDPFDFEDGYLYDNEFRGIVVDGEYWALVKSDEEIMGNAPISPIITVHSSDGSGMDYTYYTNLGVSKGGGHLNDGENDVPYYYWTPYQNLPALSIRGHGTVDITFRKGSL